MDPGPDNFGTRGGEELMKHPLGSFCVNSMVTHTSHKTICSKFLKEKVSAREEITLARVDNFFPRFFFSGPKVTAVSVGELSSSWRIYYHALYRELLARVMVFLTHYRPDNLCVSLLIILTQGFFY